MTTNALTIRDDMNLSELGEVFYASGFFTDVKSKAQAIVKIVAGRELGFGPMASMKGIYIIQGQPAISALLMGASIKKTGHYDYRLREHSDKICSIDFFQRTGAGEKWENVGNSTFTIEDAKKAGTKNMEKFPKNMLFARAMSNGARWYTPDIFGGPVYTPEELGANVNEAGEVIIDAAPIIQQPEPVSTNDNGHEPQSEQQPGIEYQKALDFTDKDGRKLGNYSFEELTKVKAHLTGLEKRNKHQSEALVCVEAILAAQSAGL